MSIVVSDVSAIGEALAIALQTPLAIDWALAATIPGHDTASGISNIGGGRMVAVVGATYSLPFSSLKRGEVWASNDDGKPGSWQRTSGLAMFSELGVSGEDVFSMGAGLLCYKPSDWLHAEDGKGPSSGDAGGIIRAHQNRDVGPGTPIFLLTGWSQFGRPSMNGRRDVATRKFAVWPGLFQYEMFRPDPVIQGQLLLQLSQAGATSLTTAFILNELEPGAAYAQSINPDGSISWIWVTEPPLIGSSTLSGTIPGLMADSYFYMIASHDGVIWRPYGDTSEVIGSGRMQGIGINSCGEAFFLSDHDTLLLGVNVTGLSPCIFKSTARGAPGTFKEIVMPGNFFNFIPQGQKGQFVFSSLYVMTHCFCELDDGTVLCAGGAPTAVNPVSNNNQTSPAYHYAVIWRSEDKAETWENISLNNELPSPLPDANDYWYEGRTLLALGGQAAFLGCNISTDFVDPTWTPFFLTKDGVNFVKSVPTSRVGMFALDASVYPTVVQTTFADDGTILAIVSLLYAGPGNVGQVEIWRGMMTGGILTGRTITGEPIIANPSGVPPPGTPPPGTPPGTPPVTPPGETDVHRAVGFLEQRPPSSMIPEQELGRG